MSTPAVIGEVLAELIPTIIKQIVAVFDGDDAALEKAQMDQAEQMARLAQKAKFPRG